MMDIDDESADSQRLRIAFVGPCGAGKSTIAHRLRELGIDARMPAQEHSGVPSMWQKMLHPDYLVVLDAPNPVLRQRRPGINLHDDYLAEQRRRLGHAITHAHATFNTAAMTPDEIVTAILKMIDKG